MSTPRCIELNRNEVEVVNVDLRIEVLICQLNHFVRKVLRRRFPLLVDG